MVVNQSISLCHVGKTDLQTVLVELTSWVKYMQFLKIGAHWYLCLFTDTLLNLNRDIQIRQTADKIGITLP